MHEDTFTYHAFADDHSPPHILPRTLHERARCIPRDASLMPRGEQIATPEIVASLSSTTVMILGYIVSV